MAVGSSIVVKVGYWLVITKRMSILTPLPPLATLLEILLLSRMLTDGDLRRIRQTSRSVVDLRRVVWTSATGPAWSAHGAAPAAGRPLAVWPHRDPPRRGGRETDVRVFPGAGLASSKEQLPLRRLWSPWKNVAQTPLARGPSPNSSAFWSAKMLNE